ncbi:MAG: hypothetical protein JNL67_22645 [Planctomycetaceae bacterium]|nr:hypothetical protein [Planctomycetaceae bacterium]
MKPENVRWIVVTCRWWIMAARLSVTLGALKIAGAGFGGVASAQSEVKLQEHNAEVQRLYEVPGFEREMALLERMHTKHQESSFSDCTLWDRWLPHASLWTGATAISRYRRSLLDRRIDSEGYVAMQQHRGMAHSDGWPFPAWQQSTGVGFHFSMIGDHWAVHHFGTQAITNLDGWSIAGAEVLSIDPETGLRLKLTAPKAKIETPRFQCGTIVAPFVRLELATSRWPTEARGRLRWQLDGETEWNDRRVMEFSPESHNGEMGFANIPAYRHPEYSGLLTRYQIEIEAEPGVEVTLKSLITAIDSRHPITNSSYLRACLEYLEWTGDLEFLRANIQRMRAALRFMIQEFGLRDHKHVIVPWVGHDGRSGLVYENGVKSVRPGLGVGNNYWDLLPFGGHDGLATIYAYDALRLFAELEAAIEAHPEWLATTKAELNEDAPSAHLNTEFSANELRGLATELQQEFQKRFWNAEKGRFIGWEDRQGQRHDFGFTFVNLEAIYYGLASESQAAEIFSWLDGQRLVAEDTSQGADIYHWRFAPRATTKRNIDTYMWAWVSPESIEWGGQVQDGGAVLGFSYFDVMARLQWQGPDAAWLRLQKILEWYAEVEAEGGYRAYYAKPGRGTLQGGGTAGGLGLDHEFFESVLVPQVMLYGFLGFEPTATGYRVNPKLPTSWPSLTVRDIHFRQKKLSITAFPDGTYKVVEH